MPGPLIRMMPASERTSIDLAGPRPIDECHTGRILWYALVCFTGCSWAKLIHGRSQRFGISASLATIAGERRSRVATRVHSESAAADRAAALAVTAARTEQLRNTAKHLRLFIQRNPLDSNRTESGKDYSHTLRLNDYRTNTAMRRQVQSAGDTGGWRRAPAPRQSGRPERPQAGEAHGAVIGRIQPTALHRRSTRRPG